MRDGKGSRARHTLVIPSLDVHRMSCVKGSHGSSRTWSFVWVSSIIALTASNRATDHGIRVGALKVCLPALIRGKLHDTLSQISPKQRSAECSREGPDRLRNASHSSAAGLDSSVKLRRVYRRQVRHDEDATAV